METGCVGKNAAWLLFKEFRLSLISICYFPKDRPYIQYVRPYSSFTFSFIFIIFALKGCSVNSPQMIDYHKLWVLSLF